MKKIFVVLFSLVMGFTLTVHASNPSYLLTERDGDIIVIEVRTRTEYNLTVDFDSLVTWPYWSSGDTSGEYVSFVVLPEGAEAPSEDHTVPYGQVAWMEVANPTEIQVAPGCEDNFCTDGQIHGDWLVYTVLLEEDGDPMLYAYNMADQSEEFIVLYDDEPFLVGDLDNAWGLDVFRITGRFDGYSYSTRTIEVPSGEYTENWASGGASAQRGCNGEVALYEITLSRRISVQTVGYGSFYLEGSLSRRSPWRSCMVDPI